MTRHIGLETTVCMRNSQPASSLVFPKVPDVPVHVPFCHEVSEASLHLSWGLCGYDFENTAYTRVIIFWTQGRTLRIG